MAEHQRMNAALSGCFDPREPAGSRLRLSAGWCELADDAGYAGGERMPDLPESWRWSMLADLPDGRYALAAPGADDRTLRLGRDPAGTTALYWHRDADGCVRFATRLNALIALLPARPGWSRTGLDEFLRFLDIAPPATLYNGVYALRAGDVVEFNTHAARTLPQGETAPDLPANYEQACVEIDGLLRQAINDALAGSRSPACFLSGGIDSALLCALARAQGHAITAWTVGFTDAALDESRIAADITSHLGVEHHVQIADTDDLLAVFERAHAQAEQPYCDPAGMPTRLAFESCMQHADRVLDGTGAEALPGIMPARWRRIAHDRVTPLPENFRRIAAHALRAMPCLHGYARAFDFDDPQDLWIRWQGFGKADIAALTGRQPDLSATHFYRTHAALRDATHLRRQAVLQGEALPDDRLQQAALATGLRLEQPFTTQRLQRLLRNLPADWCYRSDRPKRLLRDLLARHVPERIWDVPKHGFNCNVVTLLRAHDHQLIRRHLSDVEALSSIGLDAQQVAHWRDAFMQGADGAAHRCWALLNLAAWLRTPGSLKP
jgi:asparagine synthase (glutamine-hydrolysing)